MAIVKRIPATNGNLFVISEGRRFQLARFTGQVEIDEKRILVPILGTTQKGIKQIHASFIVCGDLEYLREIEENTIHSGRVFEAVADVAGERLDFAGLTFEDMNPLTNELIFSVNDMELVQKLLEM